MRFFLLRSLMYKFFTENVTFILITICWTCRRQYNKNHTEVLVFGHLHYYNTFSGCISLAFSIHRIQYLKNYIGELSHILKKIPGPKLFQIFPSFEVCGGLTYIIFVHPNYFPKVNKTLNVDCMTGHRALTEHIRQLVTL